MAHRFQAALESHFPSLMINMLAVGEETGDISSAFKHITHDMTMN